MVLWWLCLSSRKCSFGDRASSTLQVPVYRHSPTYQKCKCNVSEVKKSMEVDFWSYSDEKVLRILLKSLD